jgi:hypothetical protein
MLMFLISFFIFFAGVLMRGVCGCGDAGYVKVENYWIEFYPGIVFFFFF